jgi:hypothetical protein
MECASRAKHRMNRVLRKIQYYWKLRKSRAEKKTLMGINEATPLFTVAGKHCYGRIIKSTRSDQLEIAIIYQKRAQRFRCQLYKVSPKMTLTLQNFCNTYRVVYLYCHDFTEDGKLLVDIYQTEHDYLIGGSSVNDLVRVDSGDDPDFYV